MIFKEKVLELLQNALAQRPNLFLIEFTINSANIIFITLDGDTGVNLQDCIDISKEIDNNLDREEQDFSLEVASAGVSLPLKTVRQYKKNIGRTLKIKTETEAFEAQLINANEDRIELTWSSREPKKTGKGKETVINNKQIPYTEIKEAIVTINFN